MSKDPAFLFYPGDWLGGTLGMTFEEKGAYMELLMLQFNRGHMTSHMIGQVVGQLWVKLQDKFIQDEDGLWYNKRLDDEKEKRKRFVSSRKNNKTGKNQHNKTEKDLGHMTYHMENENINENVIVFNTDKETIENSIFSDELLISDLKRMNPGKDLKIAFDQCWNHFSQLPNPLPDWMWRQKFSSWITNMKTSATGKTNKFKVQ